MSVRDAEILALREKLAAAERERARERITATRLREALKRMRKYIEAQDVHPVGDPFRRDLDALDAALADPQGAPRRRGEGAPPMKFIERDVTCGQCGAVIDHETFNMEAKVCQTDGPCWCGGDVRKHADSFYFQFHARDAMNAHIEGGATCVPTTGRLQFGAWQEPRAVEEREEPRAGAEAPK